ncbi:MAG TPA: L,D-transpeptidase family protein [Solirubrobacteraceae bacterium]|nr:L,D-transpeptidase family protein [Solirubrobacteraceae bacterium]
MGGLLVLVAALVAAGIIFGTAKATLTADPAGLARVTLPMGGGRIQSVTVLAAPSAQPVRWTLRGGDVVYPVKPIAAGTRLTVRVVIARPGWIAWVAGKTQELTLTVTAPTASLRSHFVTAPARGPVTLHFKAPVSAYSYGPAAHHLRRVVLKTPSAQISLPRSSPAGSMYLSAQPRTWERSPAAVVSWFPAGAGATAVANPAPGSKVQPGTPITLTFSKPVARVLAGHEPPVSPNTPGTWHTLNSHSIQFRPTGYGYGLGATVKVGLPSDVHVIGATGGTATWSVPAGSTTRLQQLLAMLGYLPFNFQYTGSTSVALTPAAQEQAAITPPAGTFSLRWQNIPSWYKSQWAPGSYGELTKAAVMAFENTNGMTADGVDGPQVWNALIAAVIQGKRNSFGYTVVSVSMGSPESESTWHNGKTVASGAVNTGVAAAPTATGTFAVFEHLPVTTMSGTNPDGSHYVDAGIKWVSYFNGGDALHEFPRAGYGYPQSDGCVEMPNAEAAAVYPYTPIGTIVHVS